MKHLICTLFATLFCVGAFAQDFEVVREPKSQEEFKEFVYDKYTTFEKQKQESKKLPKLTKDDLKEILAYVLFNEDNKFAISCVRQIEGLNKEALYDKVYQSLVDVFVNAKNVLQMQDKEAGILVCKGLTEGSFSFNMMGTKTGKEPILFTLKIQVRDGRYKIDIYDIHTEKGDLLDIGSPIELFLTPNFYSTTFGQGAMKTKRTDAHYMNVRTQALLEQLYNLYQIEDDIYINVSQNQSSNDDW